MIKVTDRFYINADTHCYMLQEKTIIKDKESKNYGKEMFNTLGYYPTIAGCLRGMLKTTTREYIRKDDIRSINNLLEEIKKAEDFLESLKIEV